MSEDSHTPPPSSPDDLATRIMAAISSLPRDEQAEVIHRLIGTLLVNMPVSAIHEMEAEIRAQFGADLPIIETTLNLIEGHLALRELFRDDLSS